MQNTAEHLAAIRRLPKVELHAHLSGSIPDTLLAAFLNEDSLAQRDHATSATASDLNILTTASPRTLSQCFRVFSLIHDLIHSTDRLRRATVAALNAFQDDGCIYLELRTTPRAREGAFSAMDYLTTVLGVMASWTGPMACRLILSVNRAHAVSAARETLELVRQLDRDGHPDTDYIVGLELSGNPEVGHFGDFEPVFRQARREFGTRFGISLHFAEVHNEAEARAMLDFRPDRVGHAACMSVDIEKKLIESGICVEVCLTSNLITRSVESLQYHPLVTVLAQAKHNFCICTDDSGIFRTSLSEEFALLWAADCLPNASLSSITTCAIAHSFAPENLKTKLRTRLRDQV